MNPKFLKPAPIGFEDLELDTARVADALATRGDTAGDGENEAAQRIDDLLLVIRNESEPETRLTDAPVAVKGWSPRNFAGRYVGETTLAEAIALSLNSVAVRVTERVGPGRVAAMARRLGITEELGRRVHLLRWPRDARNDPTLFMTMQEVFVQAGVLGAPIPATRVFDLAVLDDILRASGRRR